MQLYGTTCCKFLLCAVYRTAVLHAMYCRLRPDAYRMVFTMKTSKRLHMYQLQKINMLTARQ